MINKFSAKINALVAQLDRVPGFEPVGCRFDSCRAHTFKSALLLLLCASLTSCAFLHRKPKKFDETALPQRIVVLPVKNQSQDITMPVLMQYFLEEQAAKKGFKFTLRFQDVNTELRQLGISDASQINESNVRNIGSSLKADGVLLGTLLESSLERGRRTIRASFRFVSVVTGATLWENRVELEEKIEGRLPVKGTVTTEWTFKQARSLARSDAGKLPKKLVRDALKTLKR